MTKHGSEIFFLVCFGSHLAMLKAYSLLCPQGSPLPGLQTPCKMPRIEPVQRSSALPARLSLCPYFLIESPFLFIYSTFLYWGGSCDTPLKTPAYLNLSPHLLLTFQSERPTEFSGQHIQSLFLSWKSNRRKDALAQSLPIHKAVLDEDSHL